MERIEAHNRNSIGEMEELRADNEQLTAKHSELVEKYLRNYNELTHEKATVQRLEQ